MIPFHFYYSWSVPFFIGHYPLPLLPRFPSALPLFYPYHPFHSFPWLSQHHVTMHIPTIADPDIAEVTRLASSLLSSSTPSYPLTTPVETYMWLAYAIRHSLSHVHSGITHCDTKLRLNSLILLYLGSSQITTQSSDLLSNLRTFLGFSHGLDPFGSIRIILGSIWLIFDIGDRTFFRDSLYQ